MSPKDVMIQTLRAWMIGDYGHDLPAEHFEQEVDRLISGLEEFGFVIMPREATRTMTMAGCDSLPSCEHVFGHAGEMLRNAYAKMVKAVVIPSPKRGGE